MARSLPKSCAIWSSRATAFENPSARSALFAPSPDGHAASVLYDPAETAGASSRAFRERFRKVHRICRSARALRRVLGEVLTITPPDIDKPSPEEIWKLLKVGRSVRSLGKKGHMRSAALGPDGRRRFRLRIFRNGIAPRRHRCARNFRRRAGAVVGGLHGGASAARRGRSASGGLGLIPARRAWRAHAGAGRSRHAKPARKFAPALTSQHILRERRRSRRPRSRRRRRNFCEAVVSGVDPQRTFFKLARSRCISIPAFARQHAEFPRNGTVAKVNLALDGLPDFHCARRTAGPMAFARRSPAAFTSAPKSIISSTPSTPRSTANIRRAVSRCHHSLRFSIPRSRPKASTSSPFTSNSRRSSWNHGDWNAQRERIRRHRRQDSRAVRPRFPARFSKHHVITPQRSRNDLRFHRRPHLPRRNRARSDLHHAPGAGLGALQTPFAASTFAAPARIPATASPARPAPTPPAKSSSELR